ncbi:MAG: hypothetical protein K1X48_00660 [Burkholderiaceae bacterium]|nr:hypothetical protein [Burkholderiaceae bacterium]
MLTLIQLIIWGVALSLLGVWSLLAWAVQALFTLGSSQAVETTLREWLTPLVFMENWVPFIMSAVQSMSQFLAATGDWVPTLIWVIWGLGAIVVLIPATVASMLAVWGMRKMRDIEKIQTSENGLV